MPVRDGVVMVHCIEETPRKEVSEDTALTVISELIGRLQSEEKRARALGFTGTADAIRELTEVMIIDSGFRPRAG